MLRKIDLVIIFALVVPVLGVALYQNWIDPMEAIIALVLLIVGAFAVTVFS